MDTSPYILNSLRENNLLHPDNDGKSGILLIGGQPYLIASSRVTNNNDKQYIKWINDSRKTTG